MTDKERPSFTCPRCGRTSYNPTDVDERYCGACHDWTGPTGSDRARTPTDVALERLRALREALTAMPDNPQQRSGGDYADLD